MAMLNSFARIKWLCLHTLGGIEWLCLHTFSRIKWLCLHLSFQQPGSGPSPCLVPVLLYPYGHLGIMADYFYRLNIKKAFHTLEIDVCMGLCVCELLDAPAC